MVGSTSTSLPFVARTPDHGIVSSGQKNAAGRFRPTAMALSLLPKKLPKLFFPKERDALPRPRGVEPRRQFLRRAALLDDRGREGRKPHDSADIAVVAPDGGRCPSSQAAGRGTAGSASTGCTGWIPNRRRRTSPTSASSARTPWRWPGGAGRLSSRIVTLEIPEAEYLYRLSFNPQRPNRLLISGQAKGGEIFS